MNIDKQDRVATAFKNQTIFLTGGEFKLSSLYKQNKKLRACYIGSGFMGKVFIERLLRVAEFNKIYILIRPKKGVQPEDRLRELFKDMV